MTRLVAILLLGALAGCGGAEDVSAVQAGEKLFRDPALAGTDFNHFSCATCHSVSAEPSEAERYLPGGSLRDVARRPRWWHDKKTTLLDAVNVCLTFFMRAAALDADDERGRALYAYLAAQTSGGEPGRRTSTVVRDISTAPGGGDAGRGAPKYEAACGYCHGRAGSGEGKLDPQAFTLPEVTSDYARTFPGIEPEVVVTEKVRHGQFFGVGGVMPHFPLEVLSDADLADILAHLGF